MQEAGQEEEPGEDKSTLWAHSLNFPEKGCLLVAHPLMFTTQQMYFSQVSIWRRYSVACQGLQDFLGLLSLYHTQAHPFRLKSIDMGNVWSTGL